MSLGEFTFRCVSWKSGWEEVHDEWATLFAECEAPCGFYHPLFIDATRVLPEGDQPTHLFLGRAKEKLVWALPASIRGHRLLGREAMLYGPPEEGWDHLAPLDASRDFAATREFFARGAWELGISVVTSCNGAPELESRLRLALPPRKQLFLRQGFRCPCLALPMSETDLLAGLGQKFRQTLRIGLRKAEAAGISFRVLSSENSGTALEAGLEKLFALHGGRFGGEGPVSKFIRPAARAFHGELVRQARRFPGVVNLFELVRNGDVIASNYGFVSGGVYSGYQCGFDGESAMYSPGRVLLYRVMVWCVESRVKIFDFLRGMEEYKAHWSQRTRDDIVFFAGFSPIVSYLRLKRSVKQQGKRHGLLSWAGGKD